MALQMTCPHCKQEFPYYNGELDRKISILGQRYTTIEKRLANIKALGRDRWDNHTWAERSRLVREKNKISEELSGLKAVRKACDQQIERFEYMIFKEFIKERHGEEEFRKILALVEEELQAYKASGLMRHEYTRSNAKSDVTSINKL